jgi:hypothetical protein
MTEVHFDHLVKERGGFKLWRSHHPVFGTYYTLRNAEGMLVTSVNVDNADPLQRLVRNCHAR